MTEQTANLSLPYIMPNQAQKHVTHNEAIRMLDALVQLSALSRNANVPPATPDAGDRYIVAPDAGEEWWGWDGSIAYFVDGAWARLVPQAGWQVWIQDESLLAAWSGTAWISTGGGIVSGAEIQGAGRIGLGTEADATNVFAAKLNSALWAALEASEGGNGSIISSLSKESAEKDVGFAFQDGYSTRALVGLFGNDDFAIKVSPDGNTFHQSVAIGSGTGNVAIGTAPDASNRLLVSGANALFTSSTGLNLVLNKGGADEDLGLAFQSGYETQALVGLLADTSFVIKVGPGYTAAIVIDTSTGAVTHAQNPKFSASSTVEHSVPVDTWTTVVCGNARHNVGNCYNAGTGLFTAPADGIYLFGANALYREVVNRPSKMLIGFSINGSAPTNDRLRTCGNIALESLESSLDIFSSIELKTGDIVAVKVRFIGQSAAVAGTNTAFFWAARLS